MKLSRSLFLLSGIWTACSSAPPVNEYTLARTALNSAKQYESQRYAPAYWHDAEQCFRRGEDAFKSENYSDAKKEFEMTRLMAEKAENSARLQRFKNGE